MGSPFPATETTGARSAMEASERLKVKLRRWGAFSNGLGCRQEIR